MVPVCPFCGWEGNIGAGARLVLRIPAVGTRAAGKTLFLMRAIAEGVTAAAATGAGRTITGIGTGGSEFLAQAVSSATSGNLPPQTDGQQAPKSILFQDGAEQLELQLVDVAGEEFSSKDRAMDLSYLDHSKLAVFVFDPLCLDAVRDQIEIARPTASTVIDPTVISAARPLNEQINAYTNAFSDRTRMATNARLAVVVTKADLLSAAYGVEHIPTDSAGVRQWLLDNGAAPLVRSIGTDFASSAYFMVADVGAQTLSSATNPVRVLDWALSDVPTFQNFFALPNAENGNTPVVSAVVLEEVTV